MKENEEEAINSDEDKANFIPRKKHKVTSISGQTTHCAIFCNTSSNEQPELEHLTPSTQKTNLIVHPSDPTPSTSVDSNSDTSDEMYEATLAEHFATLLHRTHPIILKTTTSNPTLPVTKTNTPLEPNTTPRHVNPSHPKAETSAQVLINLIYDTSSEDSSTPFSPPFSL